MVSVSNLLRFLVPPVYVFCVRYVILIKYHHLQIEEKSPEDGEHQSLQTVG